MDKFIGMSFQLIATFILTLRGTAKNAFAILPGMLDALIADITLGIAKMRHRELTIGVFGAVHPAAGEQAGQLGDGDAVQLLVENVVQAVLEIRYLRGKPVNQPFCDLPQEHSCFAGGVYQGSVFDTMSLYIKSPKTP